MHAVDSFRETVPTVAIGMIIAGETVADIDGVQYNWTLVESSPYNQHYRVIPGRHADVEYAQRRGCISARSRQHRQRHRSNPNINLAETGWSSIHVDLDCRVRDGGKFHRELHDSVVRELSAG